MNANKQNPPFNLNSFLKINNVVIKGYNPSNNAYDNELRKLFNRFAENSCQCQKELTERVYKYNFISNN